MYSSPLISNLINHTGLSNDGLRFSPILPPLFEVSFYNQEAFSCTMTMSMSLVGLANTCSRLNSCLQMMWSRIRRVLQWMPHCSRPVTSFSVTMDCQGGDKTRKESCKETEPQASVQRPSRPLLESPAARRQGSSTHAQEKLTGRAHARGTGQHAHTCTCARHSTAACDFARDPVSVFLEFTSP